MTDIDEGGRVTSGQVVAASKHSRAVWNKLIKIHFEHKEDRSHYYVLNAYPHNDSGGRFKEILDNVDLSRLPRGILQSVHRTSPAAHALRLAHAEAGG